MALVRLGTLMLTGASVATRRVDAGIADGHLAEAVTVSWSAGAIEVHSPPFEHGVTRAAIHACRGYARVLKLAPVS